MLLIEEISKEKLLQYAINQGIIDITYVEKQIEMSQRKELLEKHPYAIWEGKNGKWYTHIPDEEKGRVQKERKNKKDIEEVIIKYWKEQLENPTIKDIFDEWNDRKRNLNKISNSTHLRNIQIFNRHYAEEFGKRKIKTISQEDIEEFLEDQIPKFNLTSKSFSNLKTVTRGFLKRAKKRKLISFNVDEIFQELDTSESQFKKIIKEDYEEVFSEDEMIKIIQYLKDNLDSKNIGILLMFATGIRVGELVTLKHDVFNGNTFIIRRTETRFLGDDGKYIYSVKEFPKTSAGVRTVIVPDNYTWLCAKIKLLNPFGEYVFVDDSGKRITTHVIRHRLDYVCKKTGIYHKSPHKIRKTYGSILLDNNIDNMLIIEQMGHTNISCTENHYHRNRRTLERKKQIISEIPEFMAN